jgi:hypothetical protein
LILMGAPPPRGKWSNNSSKRIIRMVSAVHRRSWAPASIIPPSMSRKSN